MVASLGLALNYPDTPLYELVKEDIDNNCGVILDGELNLHERGEQIFQDILKTASGEPSKKRAIGLWRQ